MWLLQDYTGRIYANRHILEVRTASDGWQVAVYDAWVAACQTAFRARRSENWSLIDVKFRDEVPGTSAEVVIPDVNVNGLSLADGLPIACCLKLLWHTDLIGRSHKGCSYLSGYTELDQTFGELTSPAQAAATDYGQAMLDTFGPGGGSESIARLVILSRQHDGVALNPPIGTPVTSFVVQGDIRSQRQRRLD